MATKANIIKVYAQADSAKKVDIIIRYYPNFMGIVESYTDGLRYMIENEKAFNRQANRGELGVRVQAKGNHSDITGNSAVASVMTREALVACDFSGDVLEGVDRQEEFKQEALENIHTVVHPALQLAVRDGLIVNNPSDSAMTEIKRSKLWDAPKRRALTIPQQKAFMNYLESDREYEGWLPIITVLLGTGMRIGECIAIRWEDLDFENRMISVNHNLSDRPDSKGVCAKHIQTPKTEAGTRTIPMIQEVFEAFLTEYEIQKCLGFCEEEIDGYSGFVFTTAYHTVYSAAAVNNAIHRATKAYNDKEEKEAKKDGREPLLLPDFSAHHLRHTFCTRLCENETNLKVIMDIMGHADISTTMDIYAECTKEKKKEVMTNIEGCIIIK